MSGPRVSRVSSRKASQKSARGGSAGGAILTWPGRSEALSPKIPAGTFDLVVRERTEGDNVRLIHGDVLAAVRALASGGLIGQVDCIYIDPPFLSQLDYVAEARLDGDADGRVNRSVAYADTWGAGAAAYLDMLAPRLEALTALLAPTGTIWVHLDWRAAYLVRVLLDEILGRSAFLNEIVWRRAPNLGRQAQSKQFGRTLDTLVVYGGRRAALRPPTRLEPIDAKAIRRDDEGRPFIAAPRGDYTDASVARLDGEGRIHRTASGKVYVKYFLVEDREGRLCRERRVDALWDDIVPMRHRAKSERTGYPTQKPRELLERVIASATEAGGLVLDGFAGSGTTGAAAHALGRRAILVDQSPVAIATARARLLREGVPLEVSQLAGTDACPEIPAGVQVKRRGRELELVRPTEPLAWAVGRRDASGALQTLWHGERVPGTRATPVPRVAPLEGDGPWTARVWADDGSCSDVAVPVRAGRERGTS